MKNKLGINANHINVFQFQMRIRLWKKEGWMSTYSLYVFSVQRIVVKQRNIRENYWRKRTDKNITKKCLFHHNKSHAHKAYFVLHQKRIRKQQENEGKTKIKVMFSWWWLTMIPIDFFIIVDHHFGKARLNLYWRTLSKYHHTSVMESVALAVQCTFH